MTDSRYSRIGILGGMGPSSGVLLQQLIIDATPAEKDQDHLEVVCFTQPHVPDRTESLAHDDGKKYVAAIREAIQILIGAGATVIVIPCNTAYARLSEIQEKCSVPILDMIQLTLDSLLHTYGVVKKIGLLATDGTLREKIYEHARGAKSFEWILPTTESQKLLMDIIYEKIKAGASPEAVISDLLKVIEDVVSRGAQIILLGCTELSLCCKEIVPRLKVPVVDPLRVVAEKVVKLARD